MSVLQLAALLAVTVTGTAVALVREPRRQAIGSGIFGLALAALFLAVGAPDVALSELVVSTLLLPALVLLALARIQRDEDGSR